MLRPEVGFSTLCSESGEKTPAFSGHQSSWRCPWSTGNMPRHLHRSDRRRAKRTDTTELGDRETCLWQFWYYGGRGEIAGLRGSFRIQGSSKSIFAEGSRSFLWCPAPTPTQASGTQRDLANLSAAHKSLHYSVCVRGWGRGCIRRLPLP